MRKHLVIAAFAIAAALAGQNQAKAQTSTPAIAAQEAVQDLSARRRHRHSHRHRKRAHGLAMANRGGARIVGGRPSGCPYEFCACGIRKFFGMEDRSLDLAANWLRKFQRAQPAPYMVAARQGHAFLLISHIHGDVWLAHDWNSGGHLTRVHPRSIAGFTVVDPKFPRIAAAAQ